MSQQSANLPCCSFHLFFPLDLLFRRCHIVLNLSTLALASPIFLPRLSSCGVLVGTGYFLSRSRSFSVYVFSFSCQAVFNLAAPFTPPCPVYHGNPFFSFAASVHRAMPTPNFSTLVGCHLSNRARFQKNFQIILERFRQTCVGRPRPGLSPRASFPSIDRFGSCPSSCLARAPANDQN